MLRALAENVSLLLWVSVNSLILNDESNDKSRLRIANGCNGEDFVELRLRGTGLDSALIYKMINDCFIKKTKLLTAILE